MLSLNNQFNLLTIWNSLFFLSKFLRKKITTKLHSTPFQIKIQKLSFAVLFLLLNISIFFPSSLRLSLRKKNYQINENTNTKNLVHDVSRIWRKNKMSAVRLDFVVAVAVLLFSSFDARFDNSSLWIIRCCLFLFSRSVCSVFGVCCCCCNSHSLTVALFGFVVLVRRSIALPYIRWTFERFTLHTIWCSVQCVCVVYVYSAEINICVVYSSHRFVSLLS